MNPESQKPEKSISHNALFFLAQGLFLLLVWTILFAEKQRTGLSDNRTFLGAVFLIEFLSLFFTWRAWKKQQNSTASTDIVIVLWGLLLLWEVFTSVTAKAHPVLCPSPENVFDTLRTQKTALLTHIFYSLRLLLTGLFIGLFLSVFCGLFCGWNRRLREITVPIANVMAPIPAIVISPYLVAVMPSFRSASCLVIVLGVFWPSFLSTVNRITHMEPQILDSAKMLHLTEKEMIFQVLLPYILPGTLSGLKVTVTTSILMLNFAELMGASHGLGYYIQNSIAYANYTHAAAGILVTGIVVTILSRLTGFLQKKLIRWQ